MYNDQIETTLSSIVTKVRRVQSARAVLRTQPASQPSSSASSASSLATRNGESLSKPVASTSALLPEQNLLEINLEQRPLIEEGESKHVRLTGSASSIDQMRAGGSKHVRLTGSTPIN